MEAVDRRAGLGWYRGMGRGRIEIPGAYSGMNVMREKCARVETYPTPLGEKQRTATRVSRVPKRQLNMPPLGIVP